MELKQTKIALSFEEWQLLVQVTDYSFSEIWELDCEYLFDSLIAAIAANDDGSEPASKETIEMAESLIEQIEPYTE